MLSHDTFSATIGNYALTEVRLPVIQIGVLSLQAYAASANPRTIRILADVLSSNFKEPAHS